MEWGILIEGNQAGSKVELGAGLTVERTRVEEMGDTTSIGDVRGAE
jgi:hypothetical protein